MSKARNIFVANKIKKIASEGVRVNTHAPVSKSNPRRPVANNQRVAIAESMARKAGY